MAAVSILLGGCSTVSGPADVDVSVEVSSYDRDKRTCTATIRNDSSSSILVLHPLAVLSDKRDSRNVERPRFEGEFAPLFHDNRLFPGESLKFDGSCGNSGSEAERLLYVGFYVCRYNRDWSCPKYLVKWSEKPVNAT